MKAKSSTSNQCLSGTCNRQSQSLLESACQPRVAETQDSHDFGIPESLSKAMPRIYKVALRPLDLSFGRVREKDESMELQRAARHVARISVVATQKAVASVCFVVKRPGCVLCYEQGMALSELISEFADNQVGGWAVVKEVNVDNEGLLNLYQTYFRFPFFRDEKLALYTALGQRRVAVLPNIFKFGAMKKRCKDKGIEGNIVGKGEGMILGGVLIFDRKGVIRHAFQEQFGAELNVDKIRAAIRQVVDEDTLGSSFRTLVTSRE